MFSICKENASQIYTEELDTVAYNYNSSYLEADMGKTMVRS
jgi:hypothetical protein